MQPPPPQIALRAPAESPRESGEGAGKGWFGRRAESYDRHAEVQRVAADWLAELLPESGAIHSCLELGAGTGLLTRRLQGRFAVVEASDVEGAMVEACRRRFPALDHRRRDAWELSPCGAGWDLVASSSLLQWSPSPLETLRCWRRVLRPEGRMLAGLFVAPSLCEMEQVLPDGGPVCWRDPSEWRSLFERAGFRILRIEHRTRKHRYGSARALWKSLHGTGAVAPRRTSLGGMRRMMRLYESLFGDGSGVYATWTMCRVLAVR